MKITFIFLQILYIGYSKNLPLQMEIGLVNFHNLISGKLQNQEVKFNQPFIATPQIFYALNILNQEQLQTHFSKIQNVTNEGFTLNVLSGTANFLQYKFMAILDDRIQVTCLNFKSKDLVFVPFQKQFAKLPKVWTYLNGLKQDNNIDQLQVQQDIRNEGVMLKIQQNNTPILGVCIVAGAIDILQTEMEDVPSFTALNIMKQNQTFSIIAQSSFLCEDQCSLYFSNNIQNLGNNEQRQIKINTAFTNYRDKIEFNNLNRQKQINISEQSKEFQNQMNQENNTEIFNQSQIEITNQNLITNKLSEPSQIHQQNLKDLIQKSILSLEEQISHPNGANSFILDSNQEIDQVINDDNQQEQNEIEENIYKQIKTNIKPLNLEIELEQLEKISNERTKQVNIIQFTPHSAQSFIEKSKNIVEQIETQGEKLIELKNFDRAPKFSPKIQQMFEDAKKQIEQNEKFELEDELKETIQQFQQQIIQKQQQENNNIQNEVKDELTILEENTEQDINQNINNKLNDEIIITELKNNNLRNNRQKQIFSSPLIETEITLIQTEPKELRDQQQNNVLEREDRLQKYLKKANEVDLQFLENIALPQIPEIEKQVENLTPTLSNKVENLSYAEQLNQRKIEILAELEQKYNIKQSAHIQTYEEFKLTIPKDQYPQILYEKYLEQIKNEQNGQDFILNDLSRRNSIENSYQLEAAYYEWQLQKTN